MKRHFYSTQAVLVFLLALGASGCARIDAVGTSAMSTSTDVIASLNNQIVRGRLNLYPDRTGRLTLDADKTDEKGFSLSCMGRFRYLSTTNGSIDLRCNSGLNSELTFSMLSEISGYAYGASDVGGVSLVFGLDDIEAKAYLQPPPSKRLLISSESGQLELK